MKTPCELVVWYLLPAIRSEIARDLSNRGLNQKEISEKLGITQAAVSQYLSDKRGKRIVIPPEVREIIRETSRQIADDGAEKLETMRLICRACAESRKKRVLCDVHKNIEDVPKGCDFCESTV